jgi:hypothetical protein
VRDRWLPVGIVTGVLFVVNIIVRLVVRVTAESDPHSDDQTWIGAIAMVAVAVVVLVAAVRWARRYPMPRVVGELALGVAVGCLLSALVGPFASSGDPFGGGVGHVLTQLFLYLVICALGGLFGVLGVMVAGADYKSQSWKRYAETLKTRPRRPVGR